MRPTIIPLFILWSALTLCAQSSGFPQDKRQYTDSICIIPSTSLQTYNQNHPTHWSTQSPSSVSPINPFTHDHYDSATLRQGWNADVQVGVSTFVGTPLGCGTLISRTKPTIRAHVGKWFTPTVGSRLSWEAATMKAADLVTHRYQAFHMDILWNVAPMFTDRDNLKLAPYFGTGCLWNQTIDHAPMALSYGVTASVKVSEHFSAMVELGAMSTFKYFDGILSHQGKPCCGYRNPRMGDNIVNLTVGLSYTIPSSKKSKSGKALSIDREYDLSNGIVNGNDLYVSTPPVKEEREGLKHTSPYAKDYNQLFSKDLAFQKEEENPDSIRLYTTEELLALVQISNQAKKLQEGKDAQRSPKDMYETGSVEHDADDMEEDSDKTISKSETVNAFDSLSNLLNYNDLSSDEEKLLPHKDNVLSNDSIEDEELDLTGDELDNPVNNSESESCNGNDDINNYDDNYNCEDNYNYEGSDLVSEYFTIDLSDFEEEESYTYEGDDLDPDLYPTDSDTTNPWEEDEFDNKEGWWLDDNELLLYPEEKDVDLQSLSNPSDTIYVERLLLSPGIADELERIFTGLDNLNQPESLDPTYDEEESISEDPCLDENQLLRALVDKYWNLTESLMEIVRLGSDLNLGLHFLWIEETSDTDEDTIPVESEAIVRKVQNGVVTEDSLGNELPVEEDICCNGTLEGSSSTATPLNNTFKNDQHELHLSDESDCEGKGYITITDIYHQTNSNPKASEEDDHYLWTITKESSEESSEDVYSGDDNLDPSSEYGVELNNSKKRTKGNAHFNIIRFKNKKR